MSTLRAIRELVFDGACPAALPEGVCVDAVHHRCGVPVYERLRSRGLRERVSDADWRLLRAYAHYQRARADSVRALLKAAACASLDEWFVWKGAALLFLVNGYEFEAADVDIGGSPPSVRAWCDWLARQGAVVSKQHLDGERLLAFQARMGIDGGAEAPLLVFDVKTVDKLPPFQHIEGVPVPVMAWHVAHLEEHAAKHRDVYDGARLRMFYDAELLGASWSRQMSRALESE